MTVMEELKAMMLTVRFNELCKKSSKICETIGDLPIIFFPEQRKELIEMSKEEFELAGRLYQIYEDSGDEFRANQMKEVIKILNKQHYLLTKG